MHNRTDKAASIIYIPHGGGPLPLLGHPGHHGMVKFLQEITPGLGRPSAIVMISAHWEEQDVRITSGRSPSLIYDYYGFPDEAYQIKYPAPGDPALANHIYQLLKKNSVKAQMDDMRGFDHGMFIPLTLMYPAANIPCVQISLLASMDAKKHIEIGQALSSLREENLLIIGSGLSFHNMQAFKSHSPEEMASQNIKFEDWLIETCTDAGLSQEERETRLTNWLDAPFARYCHPREEHLLPLHICYGMANSAAELVYDDQLLGAKVSAFQW
ncbi:MAG: dioxygenase [Pseudomonadales bacterium]|nr:dioxygenase [Pseudomonadales bacterium]